MVGSSSRRGRSSLPALALAVLVCLAVAVPAALALEANPTREEYVAKVDPICKRNSEANAHILKGVKQEVQGGRLAPAGRQFIRASSALGKTVGEIVAVPQPAADRAKLTKWIGYLKKEKTYLGGIGRQLKANQKNKAYMTGVQLKSNNRKANAAILGFEFQHCTIDQSSFL
jgi:hypothetical protein